MKKTLFLFGLLAFLAFKNQAQTTVTDIDGNVYNTVTIGFQTWMKENLKVTHYNNGVAIPNVTNGADWGNLTSGAMCYYDNNFITNDSIYGALYNWYAVNDTNHICPTGWHVPAIGEWTQISLYLGINNGSKMKSTGTNQAGTGLWNFPNTGATNESGFTGFPGGYRYELDGAFYYIGYYGLWWSFSEYDSTKAWSNSLHYNDTTLHSGQPTKTRGLSVRCVKDLNTGIGNINNLNKMEIYPNPAIDRVTIDCTERKSLKIQVYNIIGECVLHSDLTSGTNMIDISSLTSGIYMIRLTGTDGIIQRKLIKN